MRQDSQKFIDTRQNSIKFLIHGDVFYFYKNNSYVKVNKRNHCILLSYYFQSSVDSTLFLIAHLSLRLYKYFQRWIKSNEIQTIFL